MKEKTAYVVGSSVRKSLSPTIFNYWFKKYNVEGKYFYKEIKEEKFDEKIKTILKEENLCGLNITTPFKEKIISHLTKIDNHSTNIGAVNCVTIKKNIYEGANTDWTGFQSSLEQFLEENQSKITRKKLNWYPLYSLRRGLKEVLNYNSVKFNGLAKESLVYKDKNFDTEKIKV